MTPILHHYPMSPYAELVRRALGLKRLAWQSVIIPNIAPKPLLTPLTGGYRKTPVLQLGADIYCDTAIIVDALEAAFPEPTLFPAPLGRAGALIAAQAGGMTFSQSVGAAMAPHVDKLPEEFFADRKALFGFDKEGVRRRGPHNVSQLTGWLARTEDALADGRAFIGGDAPGYADCATWMNIWFQGNFGVRDARLAPFPHLQAWVGRIEAIGTGSLVEITGEDALAIARDATPTVTPEIAEDGFAADQPVVVRTEDPGADAVHGTLARITPRDIVILRDDPQVGRVAVHFPRLGQIVTPA